MKSFFASIFKDRKGDLESFADDYTCWEEQFAIKALFATEKTPRQVLNECSTILKDLDAGEIICLYWRLRILYETWINKVIGAFTDEEIDKAIDAAHKRREELAAKRKAKIGREPLHTGYNTMRQDTKGSPEDEKMNSYRRLL